MQEHERYPVKTSRHSSHSLVVDLCGEGRGRRLLDVGCARGHLAGLLMSRGWDVTGIEADASDAAEARSRGVKVIETTAEVAFADITDKFEAMVFADVLEHMADPLKVLRMALEHLQPDGRVIISIPNVAHLTVRAQILLGRFNYADRGIMDRTHLRFFTRKTLMGMMNDAGFKVTTTRVTPAPIEEVFPKLSTSKALSWMLDLNAGTARLWKSGLAYQWVIEATRA